MDVMEELSKRSEYDELGIDYELVLNEQGIPVARIKDEMSTLESVGQGLQRVGAAVVGTGAGVLGATAGLPTDLVGLINGIKDAVSAEDGKKLDAFSKGFSEFSKGGIIPGSEFYKELWDKTVDSLETYSPEMKEDAKAGFSLGEFFDVAGPVGVGVAKAPQIIKGTKKKLEQVGESAQKRLDADKGSVAVSSMGVGEMGKMVDKGLSKLAPTEGKVVNLKPKTDRLNFYSKAEEVTNQLKQNKGTGQQYRQQLLKAGVKPDEIEWLGLDDVLNKGKITKQELQDQINANRIELDEVQFKSEADSNLNFKETEILDTNDPYLTDIISEQSRRMVDYNENLDPEVAQDSIRNLFKRAYSEVKKYVDKETGYVIIGNDNIGYDIFANESDSKFYKNSLTEPISDIREIPDSGIPNSRPYSFNEAKIQADYIINENTPFGMARFGEYTEPGGDNYREFLIKYNNPEVQFDESHFDESNVIAHFRTKDRTTSDGKKVFYIEEIQSDWGQKFRKERGKMPESLPMLSVPAPKAPFITDTDKWTQLTLKRILSKAVDEGYDFVSISSGMVQGDRFNNKGLVKFYNQIIPKNAEKIVNKLDKNAIQKDKEINIPSLYSQAEGEFGTRPKKRFSIELTPQLKEKVKKGMAMFSATPLVVGQENE